MLAPVVIKVEVAFWRPLVGTKVEVALWRLSRWHQSRSPNPYYSSDHVRSTVCGQPVELLTLEMFVISNFVETYV